MASSQGPSRDTSGKSFEVRVADLYRALGYQVTPDVGLPGKQTDMMARLEVGGAPPIILAIECKDEARAIGNEKVHAFINRVINHRADSTISGGVMVASRGFTSGARSAARPHHSYVTLLSWDELAAEILDVRHQSRELVEAYERSSICGNYLPPVPEYLDWATLSPIAGEPPELDEVLASWMDRDDRTVPGALIVLADFGAGKTTLLRRIEYDRARAYLAHEDTRVPLFVHLREYRDSQDLLTLLRASFRDAYYQDLPNDFLWSRIQEGHLYLLLDGFDEMVERSDAQRRLELFHSLTELIRTPCPVIITSRPSYFVEPGELNALLMSIRESEAAITSPTIPPKRGNFVAADRLRRKLLERLRESHLRPGTADAVDVKDVQVARLKPLDAGHIEAFVELREAELREVSATPAQLLAFIERTYDLADLASRPMLLALIIESVLLGGLDLDDTEKQFGASGLYEIYTQHKLDFDYAKGRTRQRGLSVDARRDLAEQLAIALYRNSTLELDLSDLLDEVLAEDNPARPVLEASGLSREEIATDFATCSFVTLTPDGRCRFVHKSFRGFFVARVLKEILDKRHPLMSEWLEREVLYFLGGFAPTETTVGERLWAKFLHTPQEAATERRNALVAFLYTKPDHDTRLIAEAEVADAGFGRLRFVGSRMRSVTWRKCTVMKLEVEDARWIDTRFVECQIAEMAPRRGRLELALRDTTIETLTADHATGVLEIDSSDVHACRLDASALRVNARAGHFGAMEVNGGEVAITAAGELSLLEDVKLDGTRAELAGSCAGMVRAARSAITFSAGKDTAVRWELRQCAVNLDGAIDEDDAGRTGVAFAVARPEADPQTVVVTSEPMPVSLLSATACGVFGRVAPAPTRLSRTTPPTTWGVVDADDLLQRRSPTEAAVGFRWGDMLLVPSDWYAREVAPGGRLSAVHELLEGTRRGATLQAGLDELVSAARDQYRTVSAEPWAAL